MAVQTAGADTCAARSNSPAEGLAAVSSSALEYLVSGEAASSANVALLGPALPLVQLTVCFSRAQQSVWTLATLLDLEELKVPAVWHGQVSGLTLLDLACPKLF